MKYVLWSSIVGLVLLAGCGTGPDGVEVSQEAASRRVGPTRRIAALVTQTNIVSNLTTVGAKAVDPDLVNAWGLAFSPFGPAWVSSNGKGLSPVYDPNGKVLLKVTIPPLDNTEGAQSAPTGQVFNSDKSAFEGDLFIFVTEDGSVAGWQPSDGTTAMLRYPKPEKPEKPEVVKSSKHQPAIFKGVAIAESHGRKHLYAADFHNGRILVLNDNYEPLRTRGFVDRALPKGFAPFNVVEHDGLLFVSYAKQDADAKDDAAGPGNGFIDVFEPDGDLVQRLVSRGALDSPWGMAFMADGTKGCKGNRLLVGNFGDGRINVFGLEPVDGRRLDAGLLGALGDESTGAPLVIDGLWALVFGPGAGGFDADDLYFTAGPNHEEDGLFGEIGFD